ncbi:MULTISPECIES: hypothetical protein [Halorussus]|uniref:hypothetical protein n=1 Tax=Halorussus TaxID=1070314 RepID=UPI000E21B15F|nr:MULTISPECIES: hypothetical protein [Halorussus]NHN59447.1 hypothetical protein [Halorussus sp. JP-T4]
MATSATSRLRQLVKLGVVALVVGPLLVRWGFVGADLVPAISSELPALAVSSGLVVRAVGLTLVAVVVGLLVRQKRSARGQRSSADASEWDADRQIDASEERDASGRR